MNRFILLFTTIIICASCNFKTGSGNLKTETRNVGSFDIIHVSGGFDVEVRIGAETSIVVEADDNIIDHIQTSVSGNTLNIRTEGLNNISDVHMKVLITTAALKRVKASASADVEVFDVIENSNPLSFKASSSASIRAEVAAPEVETEASSSATIHLKGRTRQYNAQASSSATIRSFDLLSENTTVKASSSAEVEVHASVRLDASASSSGSVVYKGEAAVSKSESSSGSVRKND